MPSRSFSSVRVATAFFVLTLFLGGLVCAADQYEVARFQMVQEQIQARGIGNTATLQAMRSTPRHLFVPERYQSMAYGDFPLPIGCGQTISQPYIVALMTELLDPRPGDRVLEVGTGSGYQAAILSQIVKEVYSIEIIPELARNSAALLKHLGYRNVFVREGDGYKGWPEMAPFDRIIVTAAPDEVPKALTDQLKPGGKLVAPVGEIVQQLVVVEKQRDGSLKRTVTIPVRFVPMVPGR